MRLAFGLVGILGTLIALVFFFSFAYLPYTQQVVTKGQSAQAAAQQIAGIDSSGSRVSQRVAFTPVLAGNRLRAMQVQWITPSSSYQSFYGIMPGDEIEAIGPQTVRDIGDEGMARALAYEAYQRQWDLVINRKGRRFTLPQDAAAAAAYVGMTFGPATPPPAPAAATVPPATPAPGAAPAAAPAPAPGSGQDENALRRQLDAITNFGQKSAD